MKVFISADIEGITNITHWNETEIGKAEYAEFREQMTAEVVAACEGALEAGATELWVRDAHDSARNLIPSTLPRKARLVRGWAPDPTMMMQELDETFDAAAMIGYHSRAGAGTSPLEHTMTGAWTRITINDRDVSEFFLNTHIAAMFKVPVVFVSGDQGLCEDVAALNPAITTVAVKRGVGNSTISIHPEMAVARIREGMIQALNGDLSKCLVTLPKHFSVDIQYKDHTRARQYSFYPGAKLMNSLTIHFEHTDYYEVLRFMFFVS